jgi:hypothetical protein
LIGVQFSEKSKGTQEREGTEKYRLERKQPNGNFTGNRQGRWFQRRCKGLRNCSQKSGALNRFLIAFAWKVFLQYQTKPYTNTFTAIRNPGENFGVISDAQEGGVSTVFPLKIGVGRSKMLRPSGSAGERRTSGKNADTGRGTA